MQTFQLKLHLGHKNYALSSKTKKKNEVFFYFKQAFIGMNNHFETGLLPYVVVVSGLHSVCGMFPECLSGQGNTLILARGRLIVLVIRNELK